MKIDKIFVICFGLLLVLLIFLLLFLRNNRDYNNDNFISFACQTPFLEKKLWDDFNAKKTIGSAESLGGHFLQCEINNWYLLSEESEKCKKQQIAYSFLAENGDVDKRFEQISESFDHNKKCYAPKITREKCIAWIKEYKGANERASYNAALEFSKWKDMDLGMSMLVYKNLAPENINLHKNTALEICNQIKL